MPAADLVDAPLWEAGVGMASVVFPVYRGAATSSFYALPIPYLVYRGKLLRADHDGAYLEFMRPTVEAGPSLEVRLWRSLDERTRVSAQLPLRAAIAVEWSPRLVGAVGSAFLNFDHRNPVGCQGCDLGLRLGPMFETRDYNQYYYGVDPEYARTGRPAYAASGGYAGLQYLGSFSKRFAHSWLGAFVRYDSLAGASFEASPLVQSRHYFAVGIGFSWILRTSTETVRVDPAQD